MPELPWSWMCEWCDITNSKLNTACFNCKKPKDALQADSVTVISASIKDPRRTLAQSSTLGSISNEGDWTCPSCDTINYSKRIDCYNCRTDKPGEKLDKSASDERGWTCRSCSHDHREQCYDCKAQRESVDPGYKPEPNNGPGDKLQPSTEPDDNAQPNTELPSDIGVNDWICSACKCTNFQKRVNCFDCYRPRFDVDETFKSVQTRTGKGMDWICPACRCQNFAKRTECFECSAPKHVEGSDLTAQEGNSDWICTQCQTENIALRNFCTECDELRTDIAVVKHIRKFRRRDGKRGRGGKPRNSLRGGNIHINWNCPSCNTANLAVKKFCYNCSTSRPETDLDMKWACKSCHQNNPKTFYQCSNCQTKRPDSDPNYKSTAADAATTGNDTDNCKDCSSIQHFPSNVSMQCKNQNIKHPQHLEIENGSNFWDCDCCSTRNFPYQGACVKCFHVNPRPIEGHTESPTPVQEPSKRRKDMWKCGSSNSQSCSDQYMTCGKTDAEIPTIVEEEWKCLECNVLNLTTKNICRKCNRLRSEVQGEEGELPDFDHSGLQKNLDFFAQLLPSQKPVVSGFSQTKSWLKLPNPLSCVEPKIDSVTSEVSVQPGPAVRPPTHRPMLIPPRGVRPNYKVNHSNSPVQRLRHQTSCKPRQPRHEIEDCRKSEIDGEPMVHPIARTQTACTRRPTHRPTIHSALPLRGVRSDYNYKANFIPINHPVSRLKHPTSYRDCSSSDIDRVPLVDSGSTIRPTIQGVLYNRRLPVAAPNPNVEHEFITRRINSSDYPEPRPTFKHPRCYPRQVAPAAHYPSSILDRLPMKPPLRPRFDVFPPRLRPHLF